MLLEITDVATGEVIAKTTSWHFLKDNADFDEETVQEVKSMKIGDVMVFGGGAQPAFRAERVS